MDITPLIILIIVIFIFTAAILGVTLRIVTQSSQKHNEYRLLKINKNKLFKK